MSRSAAVLFVLASIVLVLSCSHSKVPSCAVTCSTSVDCPAGQTCSDLGRCTGTGTCACAASTFLECSDSMTAVTCNAAGDGIADVACGAPGCNTDAGRCNQCTPNTLLCAADGKTLQMCDATGLPQAQAIDTCALSCVAGTSSVSAHCEHVVPAYLPDVCDVRAIAAIATFAGGTIDPGLDASCTAIVSQAGGPDVCVVRADAITITNTLTIVGATGSEPSRPIAFVADHDLIVSGTIDLSAHGSSPGPGGGFATSGVPGSSTKGGGGAGSFTAGGNGADGQGGTGGAGGAAISPPIAVLMGGTSAASCTGLGCNGPQHTAGGGGGGGLLLVSCLGTVAVSGVVNTAGGGGDGARLNIQLTAILPPNGGGTGGNVAIVGVGVMVTGSLFANGGGGGGGCNNQTSGPCPGGNGGDGQTSSTTAATGGTSSTGATGGIGGVGTTVPGNGTTSGLIPPGPGGGGGGAAGHFQIYAPTGVALTVTPAAVSPALDPLLAAATR